DLAFGDEAVEQQARLVALLVAEPADAGRRSFELDVLVGGVEPRSQVLVVREEFLQSLVGDLDVLGVAGQRDPAEGSEALAEEGTDVGGDEAGNSKARS